MTPRVVYVEPPDCPEELTLAEWRRSRREAESPRLSRLVRLLRAARRRRHA